jgi:hypothetical protein
MQLVFARLGDRLLYALKVHDDAQKPGALCSILESDKEKTALLALVRGDTCQAFLFNELAINVAWAELPMSFEPKLGTMVMEAGTGRADLHALQGEVSPILDRFHRENGAQDDLVVVDVPRMVHWKSVANPPTGALPP